MKTIVLLPDGSLFDIQILPVEYQKDCLSGKLFLNSKYEK